MNDTERLAQLSSVRSGYDRWALVYDYDANPLSALEEPLMKEAAGDVRGLTALDLGCGTGRHALWIAAAGATVIAVDFSEGGEFLETIFGPDHLRADLIPIVVPLGIEMNHCHGARRNEHFEITMS